MKKIKQKIQFSLKEMKKKKKFKQINKKLTKIKCNVGKSIEKNLP